MALTQAPGLKSSWPTNMEDSIDSMSDNGCDTPLKQCVNLCSILAEKGMQFSISVKIENSFVFTLESEKSSEAQKAKRRSPSYQKRQEKRKLLRKKSVSFPRDPAESKEVAVQTETEEELIIDKINSQRVDLNPEVSPYIVRLPWSPACEEESTESSTADSESDLEDESEIEESSDVSEPENQQPDHVQQIEVVPGAGDHWMPATPRSRSGRRRGRR